MGDRTTADCTSRASALKGRGEHKHARDYRAAICLSATLIWIKTDLNNTA